MSHVARRAALLCAVALVAGGAAPRARRQDPVPPRATLLYQNFPNPFPSATSATTCVWFDLRADGDVHLDVFTLRGVHVRALVPAAGVSGRLTAGRYGRGVTGTSGCDARFQWDGTGDDGTVAPAGVYLVRLRADGTDMFRKALFRGR